MITILVAAGEDDSDFKDKFSRTLSKCFATGSAREQDDTAITLCDIENFKPCENDKVIVVYKRPQATTTRFEGARSAVAIVDSCDEQLLKHVSDTRLPAITCGLRSRDSITLSSISTDSAVIDLRRCISCLDGSKVEPQEIPIRYPSPPDNFLLMAVAAILILSGKMESLKEGFI